MEIEVLFLKPVGKFAVSIIRIVPLSLCLLLWTGCSNNNQVAEVNGSASLDRESQIRKLIKEIPDMPDGPGHVGYTPAVWTLVSMGPSVLPYMLDVIVSDDYDYLTQYGAMIVFSEVVGDLCNDPPTEVVSAEEDDRKRRLWLEMGGLYPEMPLEQRKKNVEKWRVWIATREDILRE